jgi:NADPH:quinone reductase-like Zn-dependent oxidoreductase
MFKIIIWSGATSVGQHAITLAKLSGLKVATTASPKNHKLLEDLGASIVVDYRNGAKAVEEIHKWSEGRITAGLDCVGESGE